MIFGFPPGLPAGSLLRKFLEDSPCFFHEIRDAVVDGGGDEKNCFYFESLFRGFHEGFLFVFRIRSFIDDDDLWFFARFLSNFSARR